MKVLLKSFAIMFLSLVNCLSAPQGESACAIDILFVLDASSSVQGEFEKMKEFVVELGKLLVISPDGHRVALLEFSGPGAKWPQYPFGFVDTTDEFVEVLKNIPDLRGTTYLGKAMQISLDILQKRNRDIKTLVIVVTDGYSFDEVKTTAEKIQQLDKVVVVAAGVPQFVNKEELLNVAGDVNRVLTNPDVLSKTKAMLSKFLFQCDIRFTRAPQTFKPTTGRPTTAPSTTTQSTTTVTTSFLSGCELDVLLIVDFSGSVSSLFNEYISMCEQLVQKLKVGKFFTRVAMLQFSSKHRTEMTFLFNKTFEKDGLLKEIRSVEYTGGTTNLQAALELAAKSFDADDGARPGLAKGVAVVFSDGFSQFDPTEAAKNLRNNGITVYAASATESVPTNSEELQSVTGEETRVYLGQSAFSKLVEEISGISNTCIRK